MNRMINEINSVLVCSCFQSGCKHSKQFIVFVDLEDSPMSPLFINGCIFALTHILTIEIKKK